MDLVRDQVVELKHVHNAHSDLLVEGLACKTIIEGDLAYLRLVCSLEKLADGLFVCPVKDRRCNRHPFPQVLGKLPDLLVTQAGQKVL